MLVKPNSYFLGFFGDKTFLSYKKIKLEVKIPPKTQEDQPKIKTQTALRIYEHDLHNFNKIKAVDLLTPYSKITRADIINKRFGRLKDGFYLISVKKTKKDSDTKVFYLMKTNKDKEEIPIMLIDKIPIKSDKKIFVEKFFPNEKADKLLMMYRKGDSFKFLRFTLD